MAKIDSSSIMATYAVFSDSTDDILNHLESKNLTIPTFIKRVLQRENGCPTRQLIIDTAPELCQTLYAAAPSNIFSWAFDLVTEVVCGEVVKLTGAHEGLHFNMSKATSRYLEGSFMQEAAAKMEEKGPWLWRLVGSLLDSNPRRRRVEGSDRRDVRTLQDPLATEGDLGEIGGDSMEMPRDGAPNAKKKLTKRQKRAAERNSALLLIVSSASTIVFAIFLQSTNENCNYLQSILGLFYHSTSVPEKVIDMLAHAGLSVSLTSIQRGIKRLSRQADQKIRASVQTMKTAFAYDNFDVNFRTEQPTLEHTSTFVSATSATAIPLYDIVNSPENILRCSQALWMKDPLNPSPLAIPIQLDVSELLQYHKESSTRRNTATLSPRLMVFAWHIRDILIQHHPAFKKFNSVNGQPEEVNKIPLHKTTQIPCRAMDIKESTPDGNIAVMDCLFDQGGIGEPD
ncbi:hypothetical protein CPB83DRAFT_796037, partial [Crepidotus variabilis]